MRTTELHKIDQAFIKSPCWEQSLKNTGASTTRTSLIKSKTGIPETLNNNDDIWIDFEI
jgi:hypothetical protein